VGNHQAARTVCRDDAIAGGWGSLDIFWSTTAGIEKAAPPFVEITEQDYMAVIEVDLTRAVLFLTQCFGENTGSRRKKPGKVINISSVHEELPFPNFTPYCMAKGGLKMMMRNLAVELGALRHHGEQYRAGGH